MPCLDGAPSWCTRHSWCKTIGNKRTRKTIKTIGLWGVFYCDVSCVFYTKKEPSMDGILQFFNVFLILDTEHEIFHDKFPEDLFASCFVVSGFLVFTCSENEITMSSLSKTNLPSATTVTNTEKGRNRDAIIRFVTRKKIRHSNPGSVDW